MLSPRRVLPTLSIWLCGTAACLAQEAGSTARPAWSGLVTTSPALWCGIFIAALVSFTFFLQSLFLLRRGGINPSGFLDAFSHAIRAGNYQEAWETCNRWRQAILPRILQSALERIGQGRGPVETRLEDRARLERRNFDLMLWSMVGGGVIAAIFCLLTALAEMQAAGSTALSVQGARAPALAAGNIAVLIGLAIALAVPPLAAFFFLHTKTVRVLKEAREQGSQLIASLPYEEIEGLRIGADFNAGSMLGETEIAPSKQLQVSRELTTLCPSCNGPINPTRNACPHCGQLFIWT
jgi:hypothetical protein